MIGMVEIEKLNKSDLDLVLKIENRCFAIPWSRNMYLSEFDNSLAHYFAIRYFDKVVGYAGLWVIMDEAHITNIAVDSNHQNIGLGSKLMSHIIEEARKLGCNKMTLEVRVGNEAAIHLYKKYRFKTCGIRKKYYEDNNEDALIMWRDL